MLFEGFCCAESPLCCIACCSCALRPIIAPRITLPLKPLTWPSGVDADSGLGNNTKAIITTFSVQKAVWRSI